MSAPYSPLLDGTLQIFLNDIMDYDGTGHVHLESDVEGLRFSSELFGGYASCSFLLRADAFTTYNAKLVRDNYIGVVHNTNVLWEGRIIEVRGVAGETGRIAVECAGLWYGLAARNDYARTFVDSGMDNWRPLPRSSWRYDMTIDEGELKVVQHANRWYVTVSWAGFYYLLDDGVAREGRHVTAFKADWYPNLLDSARRGVARSSLDYLSTPTGGTSQGSISGPTSDGVLDWYMMPKEAASELHYPARYLTYYFYNVDTGTPGTTSYVRWEDLRVFCDDVHGDVSQIVASTNRVVTPQAHNLVTGDAVMLDGCNCVPDVNGHSYSVTVYDADEFSIGVEITSDGLGGRWSRVTLPTVDKCIKSIVADIYPTGITYDTATLGSGLTDVRVGLTSPRAAIEEVAGRYTKPIDMGFFSGWTFVCKDLPTSPPTTRWWNWNARTAGFTWDINPGLEGQVDAVTVLYQDDGTQGRPLGRLRTLTVPASPGADDAIALLDYSDRVLSSSAADNACDQYLLYAKADVNEGEASTTYGYLTRGDATVLPAAYLKAGDYVQEATYKGGATKVLVTRAEYEVDTNTLTISTNDYRPPFAYDRTNPHRHPTKSEVPLHSHHPTRRT